MFPTYLRWPMMIGLFAAVVVLVTTALQCISGKSEIVEVVLPLLLAAVFIWCHHNTARS
ncbi:hypothetical protein [Pseudomonas fontis]|uniref:Uncharacterized protein n=1 Tax=Pseudomonas fontis TaxID=2942633 RepID=A0ABT5NV43_9PSED|nr:hypothetical protein [Pseudomonas fontis]MDD0974172.1 hypothetical protein [Pseudomonas fontis]MDD0992052.1 hypothetical protein [Pseudomonas fontis]